MDSLLDSIRKDIDSALAEFGAARIEYLAARRRFYAAEIALEKLQAAELELEIELERINQ